MQRELYGRDIRDVRRLLLYPDRSEPLRLLHQRLFSASIGQRPGDVQGTTPTCGVSCTMGSHVCSGDCLANADEPSDAANPCILTEAFGVFVAPTGSDTAGTGTRAAPYATVGNAMDQAKTKGLARVYACGTAGNYSSEELGRGELARQA